MIEKPQHIETISILGCGWLGLALGEYLKQKSYKIKGSTISIEKLGLLKKKGIEPFLINLNPTLQGKDIDQFFESDILIINFPPERRNDIVEYHRSQIESLASKITTSNIDKVLFISSTSVYPNVNREITEDDILEPTKLSGIALLGVETFLRSSGEFKTTILRFGGLIGYDRLPARFLAGKKNIEHGNAPVNLIHRDDCILIIEKIIQNDVWGYIFNACADSHPTRKEFYVNQALKAGLEPPEFVNTKDVQYKIISNRKLKMELNYKFKHPDLLNI